MPAPRKSDQPAQRPVDNAFIATVAEAPGLHRAWDRAPKVMASAVPPAGR